MGDLARRCRQHGYFVPAGTKCPEAPQPVWGGEPCDIYDPTDEILAAVEERRADAAFMARLDRIMVEHRDVLDRLAQTSNLRPETPLDWTTNPATVDVGHVVVTDPATGSVRCTCGRFEAPARSDSEVTAHLAAHHRDPGQ